jgi:hypothetical protein
MKTSTPIRFLLLALLALVSGAPAMAAADDEGPTWHDMGKYGINLRSQCHKHRDTYRAIGKRADCVATADGNYLILWVYF